MRLKKYQSEVKKLKKYLSKDTEVYKTLKAFEKFFVFFGEFMESVEKDLKDLGKSK